MLSDLGLARREAGLDSLREVVKRRGRRRVVVRAGAGVAAALVAAMALFAWAQGHGSTGAERIAGGRKPESQIPSPKSESEGTRIAEGAGAPGPARGEPAPARIAGVAVVKTEPLVVSTTIATDARVVAELAPTARARLDRIDDAGLQRALRAAGERAGLVRIGRRVMTEGELAGQAQADQPDSSLGGRGA